MMLQVHVLYMMKKVPHNAYIDHFTDDSVKQAQ